MGTGIQYVYILTKNASHHQCDNQSEIGGNEREVHIQNDYLAVIN